MAVTGFKRWRRAARSAAIRAVLRLVQLLPLRPALLLGAWLGRAGWALSPGVRRQVREGLAVAFPGKTAAERDAIGRASLVHLGMVAGEAAAARSYAERVEEYVDVAPGGLEVIERAMARGRGAVFAVGHIGNWELLLRRLSRHTQPCAVIAKRSWDRRLDEVTERFRAESGGATFWREDPSTGRNLLRHFRRGGALGILMDQDTNVQSVFVPFFGRLAATPRAAGDLALRFGAAVVVVTCHRRGPGRGDGHRLEVVEVPYDPDPPDREAEAVRIVAACTALHEEAIRRYPSEWVWMHARWRTRPETAGQANTVPESLELSGA
jgi:KDO2-lipid IV(A) lauroyltransferase